MGLQIETKKEWIWDYCSKNIEQKTAVYAKIVGNLGSVFFEEGPLYCTSPQEIKEASDILKDRIIKKATRG